MIHRIEDPSVPLKYLSGGETEVDEGLVVRAAGGGAANDEFGGVHLREVADEVGGFWCSDTVAFSYSIRDSNSAKTHY